MSNTLTEPKIEPSVWREMGLNDEEYAQIETILGRTPTYTELGMYAVMWSEHCGYKYSRPVLRFFKRYREQLDSGALENAGIADIGDGYGIAMKVESHNHPSAVEPFQGAATGVGGILRDIFTMGARPIANLNSLRFGNLDDSHVRFLFEHVVAGIGFYGNCVGVPTVGGEVNFDKSYQGNPLVNAMALGLVKTDQVASAAAHGIGNPVLIVGSRTGRDGIHGATFASVELGPDSESKRPNVQMGDPFTEKLLIEATLEALATGHIVGIQDMGAAGITCSTCETSAKGGVGIEIDTALVPVREEGMTPYEIMLSESQERMLAIVEKGKEEEVAAVFRKWDLNAVVVGFVTDDGLVRVRHHGEIVAEAPAKSLADECPTYELEAGQPDYIADVQSRPSDQLEISDYNQTLRQLLRQPTIASKRWVWEQYDHMVQTNTVVFPGSDAAVLRVRGIDKGIAVTIDCNARLVYLDPFKGAKMAVYEAARNLACSGAKPVAVTDGLNFANPEKPDAFWQFKEAVRGLADACEEVSTPVISGNVSFYNETPESAILPTPIIGMLGVLENIDHRISSHFLSEGDTILLLRPDSDPALDLSGSELQLMLDGELYGRLPSVNEDYHKRLFAFLADAAKGSLLTSAHDTSEGGFAVSLAECAFAKSIGADVTLDGDSPVSILFGERPGTVVLSCASNYVDQLKALASQHGLLLTQIGTTGGSSLKVTVEGSVLIDQPVSTLYDDYESAIGSVMDQH